MRKRTPIAHKVRNMIEQGHTTKEIVAKLKVKPQIVYNMRYQVNKAKGLGSIGKPAPAPTEGVGTPPKRKYTRKVRAGTGINAPDPAPIVTLPNGTSYVLPKPVSQAEPGEVMPITMIERPSLWQRITGWLRG